MKTLNDNVLVLNRSWMPTAVTIVRDSMTSLYTGKSRVVDVSDYQVYGWHLWGEMDIPEGEKYIQTSSMPPYSRIRVPEIILLAHYASLPTRSLSFSRWHVFKRDRYMCQYCGVHPGKDGIDRDKMTIDHILPKSKGGLTAWGNCVVACLPCNAKKANRTPEQAGMTLRKKPTKPKWSPRETVVRVGMKESWEQFVK